MSASAPATVGERRQEQLLTAAARRMPPLSFAARKGQAGRLCVVGGCREYTGAPYFAAAACLRVGADLAHIFCADAAAPVIKAYSPELIVHPVLDAPGETARREMELWFPRFHAVLVGPGLGRAECVPGAIAAIELAVSLDKPLVIDADGLALVAERPQLIFGSRRVLLTPNVVELARLSRALCGGAGVADGFETVAATDVANVGRSVSAALGGRVALLCKGRVDFALVGDPAVSAEACEVVGSPRRCGGQGDVLSGLALAFANWCHSADSDADDRQHHPGVLAAFAASALARRCAAEAFALNGRATLASDLLAQIGLCSRRLLPGSDAVVAGAGETS